MVHYKKDSDYKISEIEEIKNGELCRQFNFLACQIITSVNVCIFEERGYQAGGSAALANTLHIQNFNDVQSPAEIIFMHAKLVEMEGKPPALETVISQKPGKFSARSISNG